MSDSNHEKVSPVLGSFGDSELPSQGAAADGELELNPAFVNEEHLLLAANREETEKLEKEVSDRNMREVKEERYNRLLKLLNHSQFYVKYLSEKLQADRQRHFSRDDCQSEVKISKKKKGVKRKRDESNDSRTKDQPLDTLLSNSPSQSSQESVINEDSQPQLLQGASLRKYQLEGYNWLRLMYTNGINCILGDEMGLGKTIQTICLIAHLVEQSVRGPFLIIAPLSTLPNWMSELRRFTPSLPTFLYHGPDRLSLLPQLGETRDLPGTSLKALPIVLTSYEVAIRDSNVLSQHDWKYLVVDEGHRLKNHQCRLVGELRRYRVYNRLILTGTPLQNDLSELWSLLNFILPEIFDDLAVFESWFDVDALGNDDNDAALIQQERESHVISVLHDILSPFLLRRLKADVNIQIPPKREVLVYCPMVKKQAELYSSAVNRTIERLLKSKKNDQSNILTEKRLRSKSDFRFVFSNSNAIDKWVDGVQKLQRDRDHSCSLKRTELENSQSSHIHLPLQSMMMTLRHIVNHPFLVEHPIDPKTKQFKLVPKVAEYSGKLKMFDAILTKLFDDDCGHKVLVFSQFTRMLSILADFLTVKNWRFVQLDGRCSVEERQESIIEFNNNDQINVFLLSTRAGGLGINLSSADTVIIYDSDWNPQRDLQAQDRAHRIGQTRPVLVLRLITVGTVDERIVQKAAGKRKLESLVLQPHKFSSTNVASGTSTCKQLEPDEILQMLRSTESQRVIRSDDGVLDNAQLEALLDRSEMVQQWQNNMAAL